ncbi:hypothetical protein EDC96DRAFT_577397 [Choanephora cucurbitarum]|nr:hypothetical protein EDC96DRAFT_577397 [Choanephora cucurbitarum]
MAPGEYELPSIYTHSRGQNRPFQDSDDEDPLDTRSPSSSHKPSTIRQYKDIHVEDNRLAWLLLGTSLSILVMTVIPVLAKLPDFSVWFSGNTLWRLFDPLITLPLNLFVLTRANIMLNGQSNYWGDLSEASVTWLFWAFGAGIYCQFHGIHAAAAMFKHPIQDFNLAHPELVLQYPVLEEMYSNMRDLWEHYIAHYLYVLGAMMMSWAQLFAFRNQLHGPLPTMTRIVWCVGIVFYGLLLAGVAIEFPQGLYVGIGYTILLSCVCVAMIVFNRLNLDKVVY